MVSANHENAHSFPGSVSFFDVVISITRNEPGGGGTWL